MLLALLVAGHVHAATPEAAATGAVSSASHRAVVVRSNRVGNYAVVLTRGGIIESEAFTEPIVLERFSFGWQPLMPVWSTCDIVALRERAGDHNEERLMRGMPPVKRYAKCAPGFRDVGDVQDVESVRMRMQGVFVPIVRVSNDWALGVWIGNGGGQQLFRRSRNGWEQISRGGGAMTVDDLRSLGVPLRDACALNTFDPHGACR